MGTKMARSIANLFLGIFETDALSNAPFQPHTWWRYLDDIYMMQCNRCHLQYIGETKRRLKD